MRDTTKMVALGRGAPAFSKAQIQVYSPAGEGVLLFSVCVDTPFLIMSFCADTSANFNMHSGTRAGLSGLAGRGTRDSLC